MMDYRNDPSLTEALALLARAEPRVTAALVRGDPYLPLAGGPWFALSRVVRVDLADDARLRELVDVVATTHGDQSYVAAIAPRRAA